MKIENHPTAAQGDTWRVYRDDSGASARTSRKTDTVAAALGCGYPLYGATGAGGEQKAFVDETWIEGGEARRRVNWTFESSGAIDLSPIPRGETLTLEEIWTRLRSRPWLEANPHHPLTWIYCAHLQRFQIERKLLAGELRPRPSLYADLPAIDTFPGDPLLELERDVSCPEPGRRVRFDSIPAREVIPIRDFLERWDGSTWRQEHPTHPLTLCHASFREDHWPLPPIAPEPGTPVGVPMETHIVIFRRRGKTIKRTWLPKTLTREERERLLDLLRSSSSKKTEKPS